MCEVCRNDLEDKWLMGEQVVGIETYVRNDIQRHWRIRFEFLQEKFALTIDKLTILAKMPILVEKYCDEVAPSQSGHWTQNIFLFSDYQSTLQF